jgi:putative membrane protein
VTDEYLADRFQWRYLNAPFYVAAIAAVTYAVSGFLLRDFGAVAGVRAFPLSEMAVALLAGTLLGVFSTLTFAVVETWFPTGVDPA